MNEVRCPNCNGIIGYTYATTHLPNIYHWTCADYLNPSAERDDLIVIFGRDLGYTLLQIKLKLEERGWEVSRQYIHRVLQEAGVRSVA